MTSKFVKAELTETEKKSLNQNVSVILEINRKVRFFYETCEPL